MRRRRTAGRRGRPRRSCGRPTGSRPSRRDRPGRTRRPRSASTFEASKMPSQRMNSGTQAIDGIARSACSGRIEQAARQRRIAGERRRAACRRRRRGRSRRRRAAASRCDVALTVRRCWPAPRRSRRSRDGGGTSRPFDQPSAHREFPGQRQRRPAAAARAPAATQPRRRAAGWRRGAVADGYVLDDAVMAQADHAVSREAMRLALERAADPRRRSCGRRFHGDRRSVRRQRDAGRRSARRASP